jgi:hypothetical protein
VLWDDSQDWKEWRQVFTDRFAFGEVNELGETVDHQPMLEINLAQKKSRRRVAAPADRPF